MIIRAASQHQRHAIKSDELDGWALNHPEAICRTLHARIKEYVDIKDDVIRERKLMQVQAVLDLYGIVADFDKMTLSSVWSFTDWKLSQLLTAMRWSVGRWCVVAHGYTMHRTTSEKDCFRWMIDNLSHNIYARMSTGEITINRMTEAEYEKERLQMQALRLCSKKDN